MRRVAVNLLMEKRAPDLSELMNNNTMALALNSRSSKCVELLLDATVADKVCVQLCGVRL
jgi:hypothetical protein